MLILIFYSHLKNDLGEVETSRLAFTNFYHKMYIQEISHLNFKKKLK